MKKVFLSIFAAMVCLGVNAQEETEEPLVEQTPCPIYLSFTDKTVSINQVDWQDYTSVTAFIRANVPDIPEGYVFNAYRANTDIMGYCHIDCQQINGYLETELEGRELIVHADASGRVLYITGDLWQEAPSMIPSEAKGERRMVSGKKELKSLTLNGKEHVCRVETKNFKRIYTDIETGKVVQEKSLLSYLDDPKKGVSLTGNAYYHDSQYMINPTITGTLLDGKYVLQDPERKVYTMDFTTHVSDEKQKAMGLTEDAFESYMRTGTAEEMIAVGENFKSSTTDFGSEHDNLVSRLSSITIEDLSLLYQLAAIFTDSTEDPTELFHFEIRKCNDTDLEWKEAIIDGDIYKGIYSRTKAWQNGTVMATSQAKLVNVGTAEDENYILKFEFSNLEISKPSQEHDADFDARCHDFYIGALYCGEALISTIDIHNRSEDEENTLQIYTTEGNVPIAYTIQRDLVKAQPAIDIHWGLERTIDLYKERFGIDSYDNHGSPVVAMVNFSFPEIDLPFNGAAIQTQNPNYGLMMFGLGGTGAEEGDKKTISRNSRKYPFTDLGTIGHEFTHLVTGKLNHYQEAKALDESYADIMGKMVERYSLKPHFYLSGDREINTISWEVGTMIDYGKPQMPFRSMSNPALCNHPIYYHGTNWDFETMEEHINAGVQNYWFYLLCNGGNIIPEQGEAVSIEAIDRDSAELITFGALMYFATSQMNYPMARKNSILTAKMYFGENSKEVENVMKAWYAVGVGTDEWQPGDATSVNAICSNNPLTTFDAARKSITNGRFVIIKHGKRYNAVGQEL